MLSFSSDPNLAEQQMHAIIFYLTAFGYIDGDFDRAEKTFVKIYIRQLVDARARQAMPDASPEIRSEVVNRFVGHFHEVFEQVDAGVQSWFTEVVADGEKVEDKSVISVHHHDHGRERDAAEADAQQHNIQRESGIGAQILRDLGVRNVRLLTNHPRKIPGLEGFGIRILDAVPVLAGTHGLVRRDA